MFRPFAWFCLTALAAASAAQAQTDNLPVNGPDRFSMTRDGGLPADAPPLTPALTPRRTEMKALAALGAALVLSLAPYFPAQAQAPQAHHASAVVKSVNAGKGTVSIAHGPVASLNWPAMTMSFVARDRKMLDQLQPGTKVEFEFVQQGARYTITSIK